MNAFPYDLAESREKLLERRAAWAGALENENTDHTGRRPLDGLPRPRIEDGLDSGRRCPIHLARQYAAVLEATPPFVEAYDPLPGAFGYVLWDLLEQATFDDERIGIDRDALWGARGCHVNIGMPGHWAPDLEIGLAQGWGGIRRRIHQAQASRAGDDLRYLQALDTIIEAAQAFIRKHAVHARELAESAMGREARALLQLANDIDAVVEAPPQTFGQAMIWLSLFMTLNRAYNRSNVIGRIDLLLHPFYEADAAAGRLDDRQARFLLKALLVHDTHFMCIGGTDAEGNDASNRVSYLVLEAWREIRGPANIGLRVHAGTPPDLLQLAARCLLETGEGTPTLVNDAAIAPGLVANGMAESVARTYAYGGCHWWTVPGRHYGLADGTKLNLAAALSAAWDRMMQGGQPSLERLWEFFEETVGHTFEYAGACYNAHLDEAGRAFPELVGSLFGHGPIEKARDVFDGALEYNYFVADLMGLANVVDSLTALDAVVEGRGPHAWDEIHQALDGNFAEHASLRAALQQAPKFGNDGAHSDGIARRVRDLCVKAAQTAQPPDGRFHILPGFYSYVCHATTRASKATPDGRLAGEPLAHGANPVEGCARQGYTAMARSVAAVQPGRGASSPLHLDVSPALFDNADGAESLLSLIGGFFRLGGTQVIINSTTPEMLRDAIDHPERHRDLVIRVTGFSAHFVKLKPNLQEEILSRYRHVPEKGACR